MLKKVLSVPLISTRKEVWRESDFIVHWQLAKEMTDVHFYMLLNDAANVPEEYHRPNITFLMEADWFPFTFSQALISTEFFKKFNPLNGEIQVDVAMVSHTMIGASLQRALSMGPKCYIPVVLIEPKSSDFGKTHDGVTDLDLACKSLSYAECKTFFGTVYEKEIALGAARRYLSASMLSKLDKNGIVQSFGVPLKEIAERAKTEPKFSQFTLLFAARFNSNKRWEDVLTVMDKFCRMNKGVDAVSISSSIPMSAGPEVTHCQKVKILESLPRDKYVEMLCRTHLSISMSIEEGFSFGWSEQIATGHPVLFPNRKWAHGLQTHPAYKKCFYDNEQELYALLKYIKENYESFCKEIKPAVDWYVSEHDLQIVATRYKAVLERAVEGSFEVLEDWGKRIEEIVKEMPVDFTFAEVVKRAAKCDMHFGSYMRQLNILGNYRNLWMILKRCATPVISESMQFKKV